MKNGLQINKKKTHERKKQFIAGSEIKTKLYTVRLIEHKTFKTETETNLIKVFAPDFNHDEIQHILEDLLTKIYRIEAHSILPSRIKQLALEHGFKYAKISIRNNRRNWGSCSSLNNISLNLQMMKLPDELIDYILLHELVHTQIKDHSERFWKKLDELTENRARTLAKALKQYSTYTL